MSLVLQLPLAQLATVVSPQVVLVWQTGAEIRRAQAATAEQLDENRNFAFGREHQESDSD